MTKGFSIYFALCIKNRMFYVLNQCCPKRFSIKTKKGSKAKVE